MSEEQIRELAGYEAQIAVGKAVIEACQECNEYVDSGQLDKDADEFEKEQTTWWEKLLTRIGIA